MNVVKAKHLIECLHEFTKIFLRNPPVADGAAFLFEPVFRDARAVVSRDFRPVPGTAAFRPFLNQRQSRSGVDLAGLSLRDASTLIDELKAQTSAAGTAR